jgi:twinkle protein
MTDENIDPPEGLYSAGDFPQSPPVDQIAFGTGWEELDQIFKMYPGQFVVVTGIAGHGKSTFLLNVVTRIALREGKRSFLYVPENERHIQSILARVWPSTPAALQYFLDAQCWIQSQSHQYAEQDYQTLDWVLEKAMYAVQNCGVEVLLIDPWNELERLCPKNMLMTEYIGLCLRDLKAFARTFNVTVFLVAHPTKAVNEGGGRMPTLADIEGSMNWYNKCDNGLIVHREPNENRTCVVSAKVREIGAGERGKCWFEVNPKTGVFKPAEEQHVPL